MPDVGLFSATEPVSQDLKVTIRYVVEVDGLPVYTETYAVAKLASELEADEQAAVALWARRIKCVVGCRNSPGFSSCVTRCLADDTCEPLGRDDETT
ncbi:MAG: hypothetical protein ACR2OZ_11130 [Verrucomicrobiales bacterium]